VDFRGGAASAAGTAGGGVASDGLHDRSEFRERARAQVIAVCESAGDDDAVTAFEVSIFVPEKFCVAAQHLFRDMHRIVIAIGAGQDDDAEFHCLDSNPERSEGSSVQYEDQS